LLGQGTYIIASGLLFFRSCCALILEGKSQGGIITICVSSKGRTMHYCTIFSRLPTSACASRHAPYVSCWMAFRIIAQQFGIEKRISDRPHAMLWLFKTYALSAGMYASQIWFTQFLKHDNGFSSPLQVAHMAFLKRILGIESTSANWCVL